MAIFSHDKTNIVLAYYIKGEDGKDIKRKSTLSNVNNDLSADEISEIATKLFALSKHNLADVYRVVSEYVF